MTMSAVLVKPMVEVVVVLPVASRRRRLLKDVTVPAVVAGTVLLSVTFFLITVFIDVWVAAMTAALHHDAAFVTCVRGRGGRGESALPGKTFKRKLKGPPHLP